LLQQFYWIIFEGVIALFGIEYFIKKFVLATFPAFAVGIPQSFACLLKTISGFVYYYSGLIIPFLRSFCHF